jgi:hypothetical protein
MPIIVYDDNRIVIWHQRTCRGSRQEPEQNPFNKFASMTREHSPCVTLFALMTPFLRFSCIVNLEVVEIAFLLQKIIECFSNMVGTIFGDIDAFP